MKKKKNRYIFPLLNVENIEKLINRYTEDELIKGLDFARSEIKQEIRSLKYLEKTIDSGIIENNKKIVVKKDEPKGLQGVEVKEEEKKGLKTEIREPKKRLNKDLELFREKH